MAAKKGKKGHISTIRHIVQVACLVLFAIPVLAAGWGVLGIDVFGNVTGLENKVATPSDQVIFGSFSSSSILGVDLMDPFAFLQTVLASKSFDLAWLIAALIPLVIYGLIRGRVFCGWVCPVNLLFEAIDWLRQKLHIEVREMPIHRHAKVGIAIVVLVLSLITSVPVFEAFSPVGLLTKGLAFGSVAGLWTLIAIIVAELFYGHRVWCRSLCPLGGFYEVVGKVGLVNVKIDHNACIDCGTCKQCCLCDPVILEDPISGRTNAVCAGDCMLCGKCVDNCPTGALKVGVGRK